MTQEEINNQVRTFVHENFIFDNRRVLGVQESLIGSGIIDSTGVLELIGFLERTYNLRFDDHELVAANFDSLEKISSFIAGKMAV